MTQFDMPLNQLRTYTGTAPAPPGFDAYWSAAIADLDAVDPDATMTERPSAATFARLHDLYFTGVRGARVHAQLLRPAEVVADRPAILMFHGYSGDSGDWSEKLAWVAQGFTVAALDCRGQAGPSDDVGGVPGYTYLGHLVRGLAGEPDDLLFRHIYLDCLALARIVMDLPEVDPDRVGSFGISQGGTLALVCAALEPRVRRVVSVFPGFSDLRRMAALGLGTVLDEELSGWFRRFDPLHEREEEIFERLGLVDVMNLTDRIRGRVLMTTCLRDQVCAPSTQFAAFNRISAPKEMRIYPDYEHELPLPGNSDAAFAFLSAL